MKGIIVAVGVVAVGLAFSVGCARGSKSPVSAPPAVSGPDSESASPARDVAFEPTVIVVRAHSASHTL
jgi:hypothetical protein